MSKEQPSKDYIGIQMVNTYKTCPKCGRANLEVRKYDPIWHDGEVWCVDCDIFVRLYDAG